MSIRATLTRRLVESLRDQGNNVTDMASLCGVSRRTIYDWLEKDQGAQKQHIEMLAKLTGEKLTETEKRLIQ
jgi:predicted transcriptional regulator